jgi:hypothetical protein
MFGWFFIAKLDKTGLFMLMDSAGCSIFDLTKLWTDCRSFNVIQVLKCPNRTHIDLLTYVEKYSLDEHNKAGRICLLVVIKQIGPSLPGAHN